MGFFTLFFCLILNMLVACTASNLTTFSNDITDATWTQPADGALADWLQEATQGQALLLPEPTSQQDTSCTWDSAAKRLQTQDGIGLIIQQGWCESPEPGWMIVVSAQADASLKSGVWIPLDKTHPTQHIKSWQSTNTEASDSPWHALSMPTSTAAGTTSQAQTTFCRGPLSGSGTCLPSNYCETTLNRLFELTGRIDNQPWWDQARCDQRQQIGASFLLGCGLASVSTWAHNKISPFLRSAKPPSAREPLVLLAGLAICAQGGITAMLTGILGGSAVLCPEGKLELFPPTGQNADLLEDIITCAANGALGFDASLENKINQLAPQYGKFLRGQIQKERDLVIAKRKEELKALGLVP